MYIKLPVKKCRKWYITPFLGLLCLFFSCKSTPAGRAAEVQARRHKSALASVQVPPEKGEAVVYIAKGPCSGKCPQYKATFYSGGRLVFEGIANISPIGIYEYIIPQKMVNNILTAARQIRYHRFENGYGGTASEAVTQTRLFYDARSKDISVQGGGKAPETLVKFQASVNDEVMTVIAEQQAKPTGSPDKP